MFSKDASRFASNEQRATSDECVTNKKKTIKSISSVKDIVEIKANDTIRLSIEWHCIQNIFLPQPNQTQGKSVKEKQQPTNK